MPNGLKWFLIIVVIIGLRFAAKAGKFQSGSSSTRAIVKAFNEVARAETDFTNRSKDLDFEHVHQLRGFVQHIDAFRGKIKVVNLSRCPNDFRAAMQRYINTLDALAVVLKEMVLTSIAIHETNNERRREELEERNVELSLRLEQIGLKAAAAGMRANETAKSHNIKVLQVVPPGFDANELRSVSLDEFSTASYTPYNLAALPGSGPGPAVLSNPHPRPTPISIDPKTPKDMQTRKAATPDAPTARTQHELTPYMQPVYDGVYKRIGKLVKMVDDSHIVEDIQSAAEKTKEYAAHYENSEFPQTFLDPLKKLEDCMDDFIKTQKDLQTADENPFVDKKDLKKTEVRQIREIKGILRELNDVAERYGCQTSTLP